MRTYIFMIPTARVSKVVGTLAKYLHGRFPVHLSSPDQAIAFSKHVVFQLPTHTVEGLGEFWRICAPEAPPERAVTFDAPHGFSLMAEHFAVVDDTTGYQAVKRFLADGQPVTAPRLQGQEQPFEHLPLEHLCAGCLDFRNTDWVQRIADWSAGVHLPQRTRTALHTLLRKLPEKQSNLNVHTADLTYSDWQALLGLRDSLNDTLTEQEGTRHG